MGEDLLGVYCNVATSLAMIVYLQARNMDAFEQLWSVMVRMVSFPSLSGSFVMKSIAIVAKGVWWCSIVMGNLGGFGCVVFGLVL